MIFIQYLKNTVQMIEEDNIFFKPIITYQPQPQQITQLDEIIQNNKAIHFHLTHRLAQCLHIMSPSNQERVDLLQGHFNRFRNAVNYQKSEPIERFIKVGAVRCLRRYWEIRKSKKQKLKNIKEKMKEYHNKALLKEWSSVAATQKTSRNFVRERKWQLFNQFTQLLRENRQNNLLNFLQKESHEQSSSELYCQNLKKKVFKGFTLNTKVSKLSKYLRQKRYIEFKKHCLSSIVQDYKLTNTHQRKSILKQSFLGWKMNFHQTIAQKYHKMRLLSQFFEQWRDNLSFLIQEREQQENNICIVNFFRQKSSQKLLTNVFKSWKNHVYQRKQSRHRNKVLNILAENKRKQVLLYRYFLNLQEHCIDNQIKRKYYHQKLKRKALDGLKLYFQKSVEREEKVIAFMEKRQTQKYFNRISTFNSLESQKVRKHRLNFMFKALTDTIVVDYCRKINKADNFRITNLLYKVIFSLKQQKLFHQREQFAIIHINAVLPLRRWQKRFKIRKFIHEKEWFMKKVIFREWKVLKIRKHSEKKAIKQFNYNSVKKEKEISESRMQQFQFSNIMATIAKIRNNLQSQKDEPSPKKTKQRYKAIQTSFHNISINTPSQSLDFEYSYDNF